ncbi:MAG: hypothetical protein J0L70_28670 [Leptolyngbya sp. UWPOB_LEPTO1]|uniref:hypothetical protein n=1 Tax=Leptolyngbya sp. UWPOB_LEPTO1 TaxID=2815653 RepID=UPI001ACFE950|nr:hypothetical protein [Leptolyngbya sp. UWPOB_LEPTO1]MBN8564510.1 hypothetical protein [Leptolyngbya sp. UWPOB_LEPTO1]
MMIMTKLRSAIVPLLFLGAFAILTAGNARDILELNQRVVPPDRPSITNLDEHR